MAPQQRMLIVQASDQIGICEVDTVVNLGRSFGMSVHVENVHDLRGLLEASQMHSVGSFDVVYLCGHANETHFGGDGSGNDRDLAIPWPLVSAAICDLMRADSLLFLAACKGGLDQVAYDLYIGCDSLSKVVGPSVNVDGDSLLLAFHVMLFQRISGIAGDATAVLAAALASNQAVEYWDGGDVADSVVFQAYLQSGFNKKYLPVRNDLSPEDRAIAAQIFEDDWAGLFEAA